MTVAARPRPQIPAWTICLFAAAIGLTYLGLLGRAPLAEPDEPRYAEIAREMLVLHDWITPHLNYVKYFEKPPLVYWLTAIDVSCFGASEFVVRLWPALLGLLGIGVADALGRSMYGPATGHLAAALLAATPLYFGLSQIVILDMPLSTMMTVALAAFWFAYTARRPRRRRAWVSAVYVATALAVLIKGPVAIVLTGGIIVAFLLARRDVAALRWALSPLPAGLFLLIALPWFVLVSHRNPEFVDFFVFKQHVARYLTPDEHRQSVWFFVPIVFAGMLPWSLFLLMAPRRLGRLAVRVVRRRTSAATLFCALWAGVVFTFFSLSGSKLATYILPMFCPLALLAARFFEPLMAAGRGTILRRGCVALAVLAVVLLAGAALTDLLIDDLRVRGLLPHLYGGAVVVGLTAGGALLCLRREARHTAVAWLVFGMLVLQAVAISGRGIATQFRPLGLAIRAEAQPDDVVVNYRHYVQAIPFYARRRVVMVGGRGELDFGSRQGDQRAFFWDTDEPLLDAWRSGRHLFLVINRSELDTLRPGLRPPPRQIATHGKKVVVVNFR